MSEMPINKFKSRESLDGELADRVAAKLTNAISQLGEASLVVSGGSTPKGFLANLSTKPVDWSKVSVTLADERWVPPDHQDSNERLLREQLLKGSAAAASFISLVDMAQDPERAQQIIASRIAHIERFTVVILGMGLDGHTASLFPGTDALPDGLDLNSEKTCLAVTPFSASHQRMTLTLPRLLNTRDLILHITGEQKLEVFRRAERSSDATALPIAAVIRSTTPPLEVYWAE